MNTDFKIDGKGLLNFLRTRKVVLENSDNQTIVDLQLIWFLVAMIFLSGFIVVGIIICLFLGCKISIVDTSQKSINKNKFE